MPKYDINADILDKNQIDDAVKVKAIEIKENINPGIRRSINKNKLSFVCVDTAYQILGIVPPVDLYSVFGMTKTDAVKALKEYHKAIKTDIKPDKLFNPNEFILYYGRNLCFDDNTIELIKKCCNNFLKKDLSLKEENPIELAIAIIKYYCEVINTIEIDNEILYHNDISYKKVNDIYQKLLS